MGERSKRRWGRWNGVGRENETRSQWFPLKEEVWGSERETQKCLEKDLKEFSKMFFYCFQLLACCLFEFIPSPGRVT